LIKGQGGKPRWLMTDKLKSYGAAHRAVMQVVNYRLLRTQAFQVWPEAVCA